MRVETGKTKDDFTLNEAETNIRKSWEKIFDLISLPPPEEPEPVVEEPVELKKGQSKVAPKKADSDEEEIEEEPKEIDPYEIFRDAVISIDILKDPKHPVNIIIMYLYSLDTFIYASLNYALKHGDETMISSLGPFAYVLERILALAP
jgi:hypothetical protein